MSAQPIEAGGVPAVLWEREAGSGSAVVLPGGSRADHRLGGIPARPDLHYVRALLLAHSLSVLELWWDAEAAPSGDAGEAWLLERARTAASAAPVPMRVAVGRSFGSRALAKLVLEAEAPPALVWIAPLLFHPEVRRAAVQTASASCVLAGTSDEATPAAELSELEEAGATVVRIDGGNHGFETGHPADDARALAAALDAVDGFLRDALRPRDTV